MGGEHDAPLLCFGIVKPPEKRLKGRLRNRLARLADGRKRRRDKRRQIDAVYAGDENIVGSTLADLPQQT